MLLTLSSAIPNRWFAEQSDVILLFFDPDKPGTTGETLECLTDALQVLMPSC